MLIAPMSWSKPVSSDKSWDHRSWKSRTTWQDDQWNSSSWNPGWQDASQPVSSGKWPNKSWQDSWEHKPSPDSHGPATPDKRTPMRNPDLKYSPSGKPSGAPTSFPGSWTTDAHHHDTKPIFGRTLPNKVVDRTLHQSAPNGHTPAVVTKWLKNLRLPDGVASAFKDAMTCSADSAKDLSPEQRSNLKDRAAEFGLPVSRAVNMKDHELYRCILVAYALTFA